MLTVSTIDLARTKAHPADVLLVLQVTDQKDLNSDVQVNLTTIAETTGMQTALEAMSYHPQAAFALRDITLDFYRYTLLDDVDLPFELDALFRAAAMAINHLDSNAQAATVQLAESWLNKIDDFPNPKAKLMYKLLVTSVKKLASNHVGGIVNAAQYLVASLDILVAQMSPHYGKNAATLRTALNDLYMQFFESQE